MKKVLIVDDEKEICDFLDFLITDLGYETFQSLNGEDALQICQMNNDIDIIISDINMPKMNGVDFHNKVKKMKISLEKFIFITGFTTRENEALEVDAHFLTKPLDWKKLEAILK